LKTKESDHRNNKILGDNDRLIANQCLRLFGHPIFVTVQREEALILI
jgi:hypothetical protein